MNLTVRAFGPISSFFICYELSTTPRYGVKGQRSFVFFWCIFLIFVFEITRYCKFLIIFHQLKSRYTFINVTCWERWIINNMPKMWSTRHFYNLINHIQLIFACEWDKAKLPKVHSSLQHFLNQFWPAIKDVVFLLLHNRWLRYIFIYCELWVRWSSTPFKHSSAD